jgi:MFS family permease
MSLALLAIPTTLLAVAPNLTVFTILRVTQGLCMASVLCTDAGLSRRTVQLPGIGGRRLRLYITRQWPAT